MDAPSASLTLKRRQHPVKAATGVDCHKGGMGSKGHSQCQRAHPEVSRTSGGPEGSAEGAANLVRGRRHIYNYASRNIKQNLQR